MPEFGRRIECVGSRRAGEFTDGLFGAAGFASGFLLTTGAVFLAGVFVDILTGVLPVDGVFVTVVDLYEELPLEVTPATPEMEPRGPRKYKPLEVIEPGE